MMSYLARHPMQRSELRSSSRSPSQRVHRSSGIRVSNGTRAKLNCPPSTRTGASDDSNALSSLRPRRRRREGCALSSGRASKRVVIFGVGDFAQVAAVYLAEDSPYDVAAFTVH